MCTTAEGIDLRSKSARLDKTIHVSPTDPGLMDNWYTLESERVVRINQKKIVHIDRWEE